MTQNMRVIAAPTAKSFSLGRKVRSRFTARVLAQAARSTDRIGRVKVRVGRISLGLDYVVARVSIFVARPSPDRRPRDCLLAARRSRLGDL